MTPSLRRSAAVLLTWLLLACACATVIWRTPVIADLSAFMPRMPSARQQLLLDQFHDGIIARLIMIGIEGGSADARARTSLALGEALRHDPLFLTVQNGDEATQQKDQALFFARRYQLSPSVDADRFSAQGLHDAISGSLDALSGSAGMLLKGIFLRDPTGETLSIVGQFTGDSQPSSEGGAWASPDGRRALLLVQTVAPGSDTDAQALAIARIRQAFERIPDRGADSHLVMSGTGVFSVLSRGIIEREVSLLATASTVLVVGLLLWVYRSVWLLTLGLIPVASAALAGISAVGLVFGQIHGLTLAFGTTLVGEAVDYAIYLFMQRAAGTATDHFWRTIRLGVLTSLVGFLALMGSGFPGLAQLGVYATVGLLTAALATRLVLPALMPAHLKLRQSARFGEALDTALTHWRRGRWALLGLVALAAAGLSWQHQHIWSRALTALNPVPPAEQALDVSLRADLGAPDMRYIASVSAPDEQSALRAAEQASVVLAQAVAAGQLAGFKSPTMVLPSQATQQARLAALPSADALQARLDTAMAGLPVRAERLQPFVDDVAQARQARPLTRVDLQGTSAAMLVDSLLVRRSHDHLVLLPLKAPEQGAHPGELDTDALTRQLQAAGLQQATVLDILTETSSIFGSYLDETLTMAAAGALAVLGLLLWSLRSLSRALRVMWPLGCAVVLVAALLVLTGHPLTILHLVGLLLVVAVGSNYALFFDVGVQARPRAERLQTQTSLLLANATTVGTYGMLGLSSIPVLSALGSTVAAGTLLALLLAAAFSPTPQEPQP